MAADVDTFLKQQIATLCAVDPSALEADGKLIGYGMDSVRLIDLIISVEETYDLEISEQDPRLGRVKTLGDLVSYVELRRKEA